MGPLEGLRFIEAGGIGPGAFCGMMLADMGADVIVIQRPGYEIGGAMEVTQRGKRSIFLDLKEEKDVERVLKLCEHSDGIFEGFRPGVMERLGLGPEICLNRNPRLAYGRISGFGQTGPMAKLAGHDINFLAVSGVLDLVRGNDGHPVIPVNLIADYAGGSLYMAFGLMCAVLSAKRTGKGQVVDLALSEGAASLASLFFSGAQSEFLRTFLSGCAPFYRVYECQDGNHFSVGAIEPQFFAEFLKIMKLSDDPLFENQMDRERWPAMIQKLANLFKAASREEWSRRFAHSDCCVLAVNHLSEVASHPQMKDRNNFLECGELISPAPTPRFSGTPLSVNPKPSVPGSDTESVFKEFSL